MIDIFAKNILAFKTNIWYKRLFSVSILQFNSDLVTKPIQCKTDLA